MNKKAFTYDILMWLTKIIFLVIVLLSIILLIRSYLVIDINTFELESDLFVQRLLYSPNGISYFDDKINRLYPGTIDLTQFSQTDLNEIVDYGDENTKIASTIVLKDYNGDVINSIIYNKQWYDEWLPKAKAGWTKGPGGVTNTTKHLYVLIKDSDKVIPGLLDIMVIMPNS